MIEITEEHYETLLKLIEQLQKDKASMQDLHNDLITKVMTLNSIIFDRTNNIIYLEKQNDKLRKLYDKAKNDSKVL